MSAEGPSSVCLLPLSAAPSPWGSESAVMSVEEGVGGFNPVVTSSVWQNNQDMMGLSHSAGTTVPSPNPNLNLSAPKCLDLILGLGPLVLVSIPIIYMLNREKAVVSTVPENQKFKIV